MYTIIRYDRDEGHHAVYHAAFLTRHAAQHRLTAMLPAIQEHNPGSTTEWFSDDDEADYWHDGLFVCSGGIGGAVHLEYWVVELLDEANFR